MKKIYKDYMTDHLNTGQAGEKVAEDFLKNSNYQILDKNFTNDSGHRLGEIDIIAEDKESKELVFVEVKTRNFQKYKGTLPEENITYNKLQKLSKIANAYLYKNNLRERNYRFDAISVWLDFETRKAKVKHIKNMFL
jgi:putative endonuclease